MTETKNKYIEGVGRRKTASARVRITPATKTVFIINDLPLAEYFPTTSMQKTVEESLKNIEGAKNYEVSVHVNGGGKSAQAESIRLGLARALVKEDETKRKTLKSKGYLKRDPRIKERKKPGLKKARKAAQWSKR
jgi:small subunit ribosomal protein S9